MKKDFRAKMKTLAAVLAVVAGVAVHRASAQEAPGAAPSTKKTINAGETWTLTEDFVLTGDDVFEAAGTPQQPCTLVGNGHALRTQGEWTGRLKLTHCVLKGLGAAPALLEEGRLGPDVLALQVSASGDASVVVEHCTFDATSGVAIVNNGNSTTTFRNNTVLENSLVPSDKAAHLSRGFLYASGKSPARKLFQGNRVYKAGCRFDAPNWLVGGGADAESNIVIGLRANLFTSGEGSVVRGNYVHVLLPVNEQRPYWSQVATFGGSALAEHNVVRSGHWVIRGMFGEFRHNVVIEVHGHNLVQIGKGRIHHNIFAHPCPVPDRWPGGRPIGGVSAINQVYPTDGFEVYNNTFDGRGVGVGIELMKDTFMPSLRSNVFYRFSAARVVGSGWNEKTVTPLPERLGYADYNCFYSPDAAVKDNYAVAVKGKTERTDAGFALNDLPKGGAVDEQVDPKFKGPVPDAFPFNDEDIKTGKVTVSQMLKFYRDAYAPAAGSPLIDAGDPADGAGTDIGAVDAGLPARAAKP